VEAGKDFLTQNLKNIGEVTLTGNLDIKDSRNIIKVSDPFFREILEIWSEANYEEKVVSVYHFRSSPLWYNSLIRVENRPVFFKEWFLKGITKVEHLMDDSGKFLAHCFPNYTRPDSLTFNLSWNHFFNKTSAKKYNP